MPEITLTLPRPHRAQRRILREAKRFNAVACGRRFGKSTLGVNLVVEAAIPGYPVAWFAPTYKLLLEAWRDLTRILQPVIARKNGQERRIELIGGGSIEFWSLEDEDAGRSRKYKRAIIDEAGLVWALEARWQEAIRATLADFRGDAWLLGTPKGRNYFWTCFQRGQDPLDEQWMSWRMPTWANPFIHPGEIADLRRELPERRFQQEIEAVFLDDGGGVFRRVRSRASIVPPLPVYAGAFVMGVDWAQQYDFTVLTVLDAATRRQVDFDRFNQIDWAVQRDRLAAMARRWKVETIIAEQNSIGGPNIEALQRLDLPIRAFVTTPSSKPPLIESLALAFEQDEIAIFDEPVLLAELEAYERTVSKETGRSRYGAPDGIHDDTVMSLALAWHGVQHGRVAAADNPFYSDQVTQPERIWGKGW